MDLRLREQNQPSPQPSLRLEAPAHSHWSPPMCLVGNATAGSPTQGVCSAGHWAGTVGPGSSAWFLRWQGWRAVPAVWAQGEGSTQCRSRREPAWGGADLDQLLCPHPPVWMATALHPPPPSSGSSPTALALVVPPIHICLPGEAPQCMASAQLCWCLNSGTSGPLHAAYLWSPRSPSVVEMVRRAGGRHTQQEQKRVCDVGDTGSLVTRQPWCKAGTDGAPPKR